MPPVDLLRELESLHEPAFGWAMLCCARDPERARDVLQASYARILEGRAIHDGRGDLRSFLFGVVRRVASEDRRRTRREIARGGGSLHEQEDSADEVPTALERLEREEVHLLLRAALEDLPTRQREVLHLAFYQGLTLAQVAAVLEIGIGSVRQHYARGKAALKEHCAPLVREMP